MIKSLGVKMSVCCFAFQDFLLGFRLWARPEHHDCKTVTRRGHRVLQRKAQTGPVTETINNMLMPTVLEGNTSQAIYLDNLFPSPLHFAIFYCLVNPDCTRTALLTDLESR